MKCGGRCMKYIKRISVMIIIIIFFLTSNIHTVFAENDDEYKNIWNF